MVFLVLPFGYNDAKIQKQSGITAGALTRIMAKIFNRKKSVFSQRKN